MNPGVPPIREGQSSEAPTRLPPVTGLGPAIGGDPSDEELPRAEQKAFRSLAKRLEIPAELPGANAPPVALPLVDIENSQLRSELVDKLFPNPAPVAFVVPPASLAARPSMRLEELEELALANNPTLVQAAGQITAARGTAIQAGTHPNPVIGYEADTVGSFQTRNYQGVYAQQTVKTAGKLGLQRAAANMDLMNAQLQLRRVRYDVLRQVRAGYFAVLVARESIAINAALVRFTNEAYRIQVDQLKYGEATAYEPAQLRTLAVQARAALITAQNRYVSAWKQLAATVGVPDLPPAQLEGRADMPVPVLDYDRLLVWVLNNYPDVLAARNLQTQARLQLRLQEVTPIPDLQVYGTYQQDFTTPGFARTSYNMQVGVPVPVFDRNRGNILSAQGRLNSAMEQIRTVRNQLTAQLADAFERFETSRTQAQLYRDQILPDLARAYRGIYERHQQESAEVGFGDIIVAQQNLGIGIATYIMSLTGQWIAVTDIANLLQADSLKALYDLPAVSPAGRLGGTPQKLTPQHE
jgi:outer membrane protein, heavy metal efflux system